MITKLDRHLYLAESPQKGRQPYCYCLYIDGEPRSLIDTSCGTETIDELAGRGVDRIINSHFHEDHILLNNRLPGAEVWVHPLDAPAVVSLDEFNRFYGFPQYGQEQLGWDFIASVGLTASPVHQTFEGGQILDFGVTSCQVVHTPGHCPGHCCFWFDREGLLFSSDIDLSGFGPWYGHLCSDVSDFIASIKACMEFKPRLVVSSHKGLVDDRLQERFTAYLEAIYRREEAILASLQARPQTLDEITALAPVYGDHARNSELFWFMEKASMDVHLKRLLEMGEVRRDEGVYSRV